MKRLRLSGGRMTGRAEMPPRRTTARAPPLRRVAAVATERDPKEEADAEV
ncbi:MAG: hypothetical protein IJR99_01735 [Kiritimatiellae bacterium]|nr:hypothetical protein [Kiritimatiellia bacterium]